MTENKLKTLKEIIEIDHAEDGLVVYRKMKAEVVKWKKYFYTLKSDINWSDIELEAIDYFIDNFFDLTEEDLD